MTKMSLNADVFYIRSVISQCKSYRLLVISQLVKGVRYSIMVEIGSTQCKKSSVQSGVKICEFFPELQKQKVSFNTVTVYLYRNRFTSKVELNALANTERSPKVPIYKK